MSLKKIIKPPLNLGLLISCLLFSLNSFADVVQVYNGSELQQALINAQAGDEIIVNPGSYIGNKSTSGNTKAHFFSDKSGTANNPIIVRSASVGNKQVLQGNSIESGYIFYLTGDHWIVKDLKFSFAQKGIMLEGASHNHIDNVEVFNLGAEAVHMRYFSNNNLLSNCYIHETGKRIGKEGFGEGVYIGTHDGHLDEKLDKSDNNRIGGCVIGPNVTAEAFDIKAGVSGTIIEFNTINGKGIIGVSGNPAADSFIDLKGTNNLIRYNKMDWGNDQNIAHAIFTYQEHRLSNVYDNQITLDVNAPTYKILEETIHDFNNVRLDGGVELVEASYQLRKIDSNLDESIEKPALDYTCFDELTAGCEIMINPTPAPTPPLLAPPSPPQSGTQDCNGSAAITWNSKTEVNIATTNCIQFDRDIANSTLQVWDSDTNPSCDFRGEIMSINNSAVTASITGNYQSISQLSGTTFKLAPSNACQYIKVRAY
ncbi:hypothetical protein ACFL6Z_11055 [Pseudomonadota bacterium]